MKKPVLRSGVVFWPPDAECGCSDEPCDHYVAQREEVDDGYGDREPQIDREAMTAEAPARGPEKVGGPGRERLSFRYAVKQKWIEERQREEIVVWDTWDDGLYSISGDLIKAHNLASMLNSRPESKKLRAALDG